MISQALGDGGRSGCESSILTSRSFSALAVRIKQAEPHFNGEPVLILNGDTLFELDLGALMAFHREQQAAATLVLRKDPRAAPLGLVEVTDRAEVVRITGRGLSQPRHGRAYVCRYPFPSAAVEVPAWERNVRSLMPT